METRRRIVEATAALHAEVGPAATTISAIAERVGVQRLTVYRHFPEPKGLFEACSALNEEWGPAPDPALWECITDPRERTGEALEALYAYYAGNEQGLGLVLRDAMDLPELAEVIAPFVCLLGGIAAALEACWGAGGAGRGEVRAVATLAVELTTWRALANADLGPREAARLMIGLLSAAKGQ